MKHIKLTMGLSTVVDDEDYAALGKFRWVALKRRYTAYAGRRTVVGNSWRTILMHREIANPGTGKLVDHIDGDGLNNRKENPRECTKSQNAMNQKKPVARSLKPSRFKGVYWHKGGKKWAADFKGGGRRSLGLFRNEEDAARAYDVAAKEFFGEFARLNFGE